MNISQVTAVYFSPTNTNMRSVINIAGPLAQGQRFEAIDTTPTYNAKVQQEFGADELVVFGAPVYGGRVFNGALTRFEGMKGNNTPCVVTVTYGNRHYDDALLEMKEWAEAHGFVPIAAAALIGQHTYGQIQVGRPNRQDMLEDNAFARKVLEKIQKDDLSVVEVPGNHPYKEGGNGGSFRPLTDTSICTYCRICVNECPVGAIAMDCTTVRDNCIACFRCIRECPMNAKNMNVPAYNDFAEMFSKKLAEARPNEYFL